MQVFGGCFCSPRRAFPYQVGVIFLTVTRPTLVQRNENSLAFVLRAWPSELKELMQEDFSLRTPRQC